MLNDHFLSSVRIIVTHAVTPDIRRASNNLSHSSTRI